MTRPQSVNQVGRRRRATWRRSRGWPIERILAMASVGSLTIAGALNLDLTVTPAAREQGVAMTRQFSFCHTGGGTNCVVDGDTFWIDGERVRIADIDAPETHPARCPAEARLGVAANDRLGVLLNRGPIELIAMDRDIDRYGRKLRIVMQEGRSVGQRLVDEGLARPWGGHRQPWCPEPA